MHKKATKTVNAHTFAKNARNKRINFLEKNKFLCRVTGKLI